jgi:hypothetical protein
VTRTWSRLRRAVAARGFTPATWIPAASEGRAEEATIREARLIEHLPASGHPVGVAEPWPGPVAFLDGIQQYEVMAYAGASPLVVAEIAAAVMERRDRQLRVARATRRRVVLARLRCWPTWGRLTEHVAIELKVSPPHPVRDFQLARRAIDAARGRLSGGRFGFPSRIGRLDDRGRLALQPSLVDDPA